MKSSHQLPEIYGRPARFEIFANNGLRTTVSFCFSFRPRPVLIENSRLRPRIGTRTILGRPVRRIQVFENICNISKSFTPTQNDAFHPLGPDLDATVNI